MNPHFTMPMAMIPVIALVLWRRVRKQFGPQPIQRKRMMGRVAIFVVLALVIAYFALHSPPLLEGLGAGVVAGAALGMVGLRLSRFELDPVKGDCYVPNPYMGALVTVLFLARLVWRYGMLPPGPSASPIHGPEMGQSPMTMGLFGLFVGYYICYFAGLLVHHERIVRTARPKADYRAS